MRALFFSSFALAQEVLVGTKDNFDEITKDVQTLVEFYAPWCGHCKKIEPEYNKAAEMLHENGSKVKLIKVDATVESDLAQTHGVQGYPTLKWFVNGEATEYDGPREAKGIVDWIESMTGLAVIDGEPSDEDPMSVTLHGAEKSEWFESVASAQRKSAKWYYAKGDSAKVVIKHLNEPAVEKSDIKDADALKSFLADNEFPMYGELNGDSFQKYVKKGNGMIWTLLPMEKENMREVVEEKRALMTDIKKEVGKDYEVTYTNTAEFGKVLDGMFGVTEFPKLVIQKKIGGKQNFIYDGALEKDAIMAYMKDIQSGAIKPHLKSEEIPETNDEPVKVIVGKTVETEAFSEEKDVLLEIYAPWCGHCKKLDPEYIKVGKKIAKEGLEDILTIAKMDGTTNDSPVESISWSGFPTMYYIKAGSKSPEKYDGPREAKGIWKWIKKNHSKADLIKEKLAAKKDKKEEL